MNNIEKYKSEAKDGPLHEELTNHLTFLINAVYSTFSYLQRTLKYSKDDDDYFLLHQVMSIDDNTNLYIDEDDEYRIGIRLSVQ